MPSPATVSGPIEDDTTNKAGWLIAEDAQSGRDVREWDPLTTWASDVGCRSKICDLVAGFHPVRIPECKHGCLNMDSAG